MHYELSEAQLAEIQEKLPPQFAALKDQYPVSISNAAEDWDTPPYREGYVPYDIDIYYRDYADGPDVSVINGQLQFIYLDHWVDDPDVIAMEIDGHWAYIQLQGRVILNRLGGAILPKVLVDSEEWLRIIIANLSSR